MSNQPNPTSNEDSQIVLHKVVNDLLGRSRSGIETYGTLLKTHNGRDALQDAYEEALDLCMYLAQVIMERDIDLESN